ncbi:MAG: type II toxin-antitoxin system VapC family toxin [Desulfobacteraceae bacterium]|nr:type II toxin-antitoxin system VapC family toxin [Desulfobacteraceae bacterium]NQT10331.1 type II toxin-antitoxin system VapC family toxin [Desulfobacteraceae bacterium]
MNLLLDTHVLLWWLDDDPNLSRQARTAIADGRNLVFISAAVIWEIQIKYALGKLKIPANFREVLEQQEFEPLDITMEHAYTVADLPPHHSDPFDRMLVAQAKVEGLTIITRDNHIKKYKISLIKA